MKKIIVMAFAAISLLFANTSCGGSSKVDSQEEVTDTLVVSIDSVMANPDKYVNQVITVDGVASHLCKHGARKVFLVGSSEGVVLRCEATAEIGGAFPTDCIHHGMQVTGTLMEERIDEQSVTDMEEQYAAQVQQAESEGIPTGNGCETEKAAQGQADIETFNGRMADYRARIAERQQREGKAYLSFYYLEATGYNVEK